MEQNGKKIMFCNLGSLYEQMIPQNLRLVTSIPKMHLCITFISIGVNALLETSLSTETNTLDEQGFEIQPSATLSYNNRLKKNLEKLLFGTHNRKKHTLIRVFDDALLQLLYMSPPLPGLAPSSPSGPSQPLLPMCLCTSVESQ
jgi:hypothetical protein